MRMDSTLSRGQAPIYAVRLFTPDDAGALAAYYVRNREFHRDSSPIAPAPFYTPEYQRQRLEAVMELLRQEREYRFGIFTPQDDGELLIGTITLTAVERGAFSNGRFGYSIDGDHRNRGITTASLRQVMTFAFDSLGLHRLEANIMPHNVASRRVLEKCGFSRIGYAPKMLMIAGEWRDHEMYMILVDDFQRYLHNIHTAPR